jgi:hypothetical protein
MIAADRAFVRTVDAALREHGFSGEHRLKLSRKAAEDALRRAGAFLDQDRFEELADFLLEVGGRCRTGRRGARDA